MDPRVGLQESESSVVNEILGISLPKRSAPVPIPQHSSSNRFIPPGYEKSNVFHSGDPVLTSSERSDKDGRSDRSSYNDRPSGGEQQQRRHSFRDRLKQRVDYTSSDNSPSTRPRFLNTNKKAAKAKEHFAKGPDGTLGFHFTRTVTAESKDLVGSPTLLPTPKSSPSSSPTGSPRETSSLTSISASPIMSRSSSSPARRPATATTTSYSQPNSSPALLPFRHSYTLPPLELPTQAQQAQAEAFFSQFNQPNQQSLSRRSSGTSVGSPQLSNYIPQQQSYQNSSPYLGNTRQLSPPPLPATIFGSDPYFSAFAVTSSSSQSQSQGPFQSQPDNRRLSNEGPSGTPVVVIPQLPVDDSRGSGGTGRNGSGDKGRYYPPSLSMVSVPIPLAGSGSTGHPQGHPYAPELRRISSDQSSNRPKGGPTTSNTFPLSSSPENSPAEQGSHETSSPHQSVRSPPLYRYQKKVTPSQSPQSQSPLDPVPLTRAQSAEMPKQSETTTSTSKPGGSPILQYKPVQNSSTAPQVPKSFGQPLQQRDRGGSSEKNDASTNSGTNNNTPSSSTRSLFQPVWKPKAKSDSERLRAEFEINSKADEIEQQKQKTQERLTQEKEVEKSRELERLRQREIDEDEKRRERERLRALERRQEIERVEAEQRAIQRQRQIEEAKEQARLAELERQAKQRASERLDLENAYENQRRLIELQALEKLKEFERAEERARLKEIERAEERARQKEYEEHERRTKLQHQHKTSSLSETWKKKEFFPEFVPSSPIASGEKKSYDPPLARPWPVTVPPQSVPQDPEWDTVPPQDYTSNPTLQQQSSSISTGFPPLPEVIGQKREQTKPQIGSTHKFPKNEKKAQESVSSQWNLQEEDIEKQAALLYFYSENLIGQPKLEPEQQVESIRLAMSASTSSSKKLVTKSSVPLPTTVVKKESDFTGKEEDEPKKEIKRFIPFNQKAVERASGIKVPASVLESNLQDQRDELMALRSIFDADFQREGDKPPGAQSLPSDIYRIKIKPVGAGNSSVELRFTYPATYPSHGPPAVSVTSDAWLTPYAIQLLQNNLEKLLQESEGQVVVYTLATWIQEESWSYLMSRSSYSNPIVIHFSPLPPPKRTLRTTQENPKPSPPQQFSFIQPIKYQRGHPLTISEGKQKTTIVAFMARVRSLGQVQQLIRDIKEKQKAKPTSPKLQGHTEQYLVAYRFASTDRSPVNEGSDGDEFGAGGSSESILRLLQKLNLYDVSVVVRLRWASPPGGDVYKKMLTHILTLIKDGGVNQGEGVS